MTHKLHINAYFIVFFAFFRQIQQIFMLSLLHLKTFLVAHPGARTWCHACRGGRCAAAILSDRSSSADNKYKIL